MEKKQTFWRRVLQLAKAKLNQGAYDFYVENAQLLDISSNRAQIFLDSPYKQLFWDQNLKDIIITAGFEIFDSQISIDYQFTNDSPPERNTIHEPVAQVQEPRQQEEQQSPHPDIKPQYTFANFVQGINNQMAKAGALGVADNPGIFYNPLFIYGGPGLGKTHLLNAIGNKALENNPNARIKYVSTETFINDFLEHLRLNKMEQFKEIYRNLDFLLIDDIQFLRNKASTQEEFFHTFNALHDKNKQIVLTSDRNPDYLDNLEERIVTRFKWGLTTDITPPDLETRIAILRNKCEEYPYDFTDDTLSYLAGQFDSNVRDLEGALKDIHLLASVKNLTEITVDVAAEAIRARKQTSPVNTVIAIETIQHEVGAFYGVSLKEIKGAKRVQNIVHARQVAMYLAREMTDNSLPKIGKEFGNRDHTTVMHAHNKIKNMLVDDENLEIELTTIKNNIRH
ncbi:MULTISPECIES: chromosomal replication initiator protein DnaA [unclassified Streptococcus]|uniref:chromosomal replication initiator protein DnaA n=1 Tax=unclassified Streptococcus TaxID=2608887 RepID=UPI0010723F8E|nr:MULTISPECIES: chromosomal replication initiator protein DnaA [unclassified Streptococcus]MBF0786980.1 chromosomal replication initiator protein DnaA [Streptococcus sp. 19428wC2_LYSM12]MCQ9211524.1 chromosomal replication initiator protein DnaA [Streptococcus sp. B01]MCQ9214840.1 chromosomal replication initiator protein DnaA [Streptococcus sp. O1]TFV06178.1 chromosomal replication initiator protein DnaA [Streptococcus sp. LYSM12]